MTVLVVNMIKDDVSKAAAYGDLKYVNIRYVYGDELEHVSTVTGAEGMLMGNVIPAETMRALEHAVDEFDVRRDYLLIAGDHLQLVAISAMLSRRCNQFRVLRWDRQAQGYIPVWINPETRTP